jgi:3-deoxy-manno-octulosonate cytidylyltransferase (CMP-KDO synthetase)
MKVFGIIPARYASTRLPAKVLSDIGGKPMIQHVYERARRSRSLHRLIVAKTSPDHPSGTDRAAEAAQVLGAEENDLIVNIQGDQPLFEAGMVDEIVAPFRDDLKMLMGALVYPIRTEEELVNPSVVKVVVDKLGFALYFSRSPMPYVIAAASTPRYFKHIGPYAYRKGFLVKFTKIERGELERAESLEQLRALENGFRIKIVESRYDSQEVDTPEDLEKVRRLVGTGAKSK